MNNYKPYTYLYLSESQPYKIKVCLITQIPAGNNIRLAGGYPSTEGNITTLKYDIITDPAESNTRKQEIEKIIDWNGDEDHQVKVIIGAGSEGGGGGGTARVAGDEKELL